jgi:hypothetical protein
LSRTSPRRWPMQVLNASTFEQQSLLAVINHEDQ